MSLFHPIHAVRFLAQKRRVRNILSTLAKNRAARLEEFIKKTPEKPSAKEQVLPTPEPVLSES